MRSDDPIYALVLPRTGPPHLADPDTRMRLCDGKFAVGTQHALLSDPTPTTCTGCAEVAGKARQ